MAERSRQRASKPRLRLGVVGGGWPGQRHAEGFRASGAWDIAAVADLDPDRRAALAHGTGAAMLPTAEDLFAREDLDAVVIALPTFLHRRMVTAALASGKHVLCEKPPALNATETSAMAEAAARHGRVLSFGLQRRAMPSAMAAEAVIGQGALGEIYHARAVFTRAWGAPKGHGNWFRDPATAGGGPLIDIGIHVLDLAWWLMGRPQPMSVLGVTHDRSPETSPLESAAFGLLRFEGGRSIQLEAAWILPQAADRMCVHLCGTAAGALVEQDTLTVTRVGPSGIEQIRPPILGGWPDAFVASFRTQASRFAQAIRGTAPALAPADDGVQLMRMIDALYASACEGREISLA
ncbi:MAG: Gfo/Idh/MocA family protein [Geminicoccales bacterium]